MAKAKRWQDMTDDELIAYVEQKRREEAIRLGECPKESIKRMWAAFRADDRFCKRQERNNEMR